MTNAPQKRNPPTLREIPLDSLVNTRRYRLSKTAAHTASPPHHPSSRAIARSAIRPHPAPSPHAPQHLRIPHRIRDKALFVSRTHPTTHLSCPLSPKANQTGSNPIKPKNPTPQLEAVNFVPLPPLHQSPARPGNPKDRNSHEPESKAIRFIREFRGPNPNHPKASPFSHPSVSSVPSVGTSSPSLVKFFTNSPCRPHSTAHLPL